MITFLADGKIIIKELGLATNIPKSRELYKGDINQAVIAVQKAVGIEITPDWWKQNVGNDGTSEEILEKFDAAYAKLVANSGQDK